ncbi:MAG TPA: DUF3866 domain-containing protein [Firmicutes bacterium]|nr:DUF3866 domain-containing protein [Bacillota bacterium]
MECSIHWGVVQTVRNFPGRQELAITLGEAQARAINYPELTGVCQPGDSVLLNTTAMELQLGTGGWHYVLAIQGRERSLSKRGHIMKLRYTPLQGRTLSVEEEESPYHEIMAQADSLHGLPVAVGSLHSMLAPLAWTFYQRSKGKRLVYVMSDGAALPLAFSKVVSSLKNSNRIYRTITFGHAFGGDLEAVNIYSALLAAKHVAQADAAVVLMGPGVVGTGTKWGTTALEQGMFLTAALQLGGRAVAIPRLSEKDPRARHRGLSHHTRTALTRVVQSPVYMPMPNYFRTLFPETPQLEGLHHKLVWEATEESFKALHGARLTFSTMGRGLKDDPLFFHGVLAAALFLARLN